MVAMPEGGIQVTSHYSLAAPNPWPLLISNSGKTFKRNLWTSRPLG